MNKINSPVINKIYQTKMIMWFAAIALMIIAIICFILGDIGSVVKDNSNPVHFSEAYNNEELEEGKRVCIYAVEEPYLIGYYDENECYYFVYDYYEDVYILRTTESDAADITAEINANDYCEIDGVIYELDDTIIAESLNYLNEDNSDPWTEDEFEQYFEGVAIWQKDVDPEPILIVIGSILLIAGIVLLVFSYKGFMSYYKTLRDMTLQEAAEINAELADPSSVIVPQLNTYFTPNKIISAGPTLEVVSYADAIWMYSQAGKNITVWDKDYQQHEICFAPKNFVNKEETFNNIMATIQSKNPSVEAGYEVNKMYQYTNLGKQILARKKIEAKQMGKGFGQQPMAGAQGFQGQQPMQGAQGFQSQQPMATAPGFQAQQPQAAAPTFQPQQSQSAAPTFQSQQIQVGGPSFQGQQPQMSAPVQPQPVNAPEVTQTPVAPVSSPVTENLAAPTAAETPAAPVAPEAPVAAETPTAPVAPTDNNSTI